MLSGKLIHLIETHEAQITDSIVESIRRRPDLYCLSSLPESMLREKCEEILQNLGHWLAHGHRQYLAGEYEALGKLRFEEAIPLDESIIGLDLMRNKIMEFLEAQGIEPDALALYAEEQLLRHIVPFFDLLIIHLVRGYEKARRHAAFASA
jgi:hypothetical protein